MDIVHAPMDVWFVWTKYGRRPTFVHNTREDAEREAARLAAKRPGKKFIVMQTVSKFHCDSGSGPEGENSRSEVEGAAPQSGGAAASPDTYSPASVEAPINTTAPATDGAERGEG